MIEAAKTILSDLVAFPTVSSDSNLDMIAYLAEQLEDCGARVDILPDANGQKASLFATLGPEREGGIVLSGHCDVVPVTGQDWSSDPFRMTERDGRLFGRGTCDMKGFIAATLALAPSFAERVHGRPLHFAFTHDEEVGCLGAGQLAQSLVERGIKPGIAIVGEPTGMRPVEGHKGCFEYTTRFVGRAGHGSTPDHGVNAVEYAARYIARLLEVRDHLKSVPPQGSRFDPPWTTVNIGTFHGGSGRNVIASEARVDWEMRPVQATDASLVKQTMARYCDEILLPAMRSVHCEATIETEVIGEVVGLAPEGSSQALRLLSELTGFTSAGVVPFGTEAGIFQSIGIDAILCGPGSIEQAHKPDEYLTLEQLKLCLDMLDRLGLRLAAEHEN